MSMSERVQASRRWPAVVLAVFVAVSELVGYGFSQATRENGWQPQWPSPLLAAVGAVAIGVGVWLLLTLWFRAWDRADDQPRGAHSPQVASRRRWPGRRFFLLCLALMALSWLPYLVAYFPGTLPWDGVRSMNQFITTAPLENHHPVAMNALYAGLMTLGRLTGSDNAGVFLIVLLQTAVCALAFSDSLTFARRAGATRPLLAVGLAFYCIHPMWGLFMQAAIKDTMFFGVFVLYVTCVARVLVEGEPRQWAGFAASAAAVCFCRNNGIYIVLVTSVGMLVWLARRSCGRGARLVPAMGMLALAPVAYLLAFNLLWPALGINTHEDKEMLSVPLQQTARYLNRHGDDVTEAEHDAIAAILPYDELAGLYLPDLADPVKEALVTQNGSLPPEERSAYVAAWRSMFLRHPSTYAAATVANTYAYFYPWTIVGPEIDRPLFYTFQQGLPINQNFDVTYVMPDSVRDALTAAVAVEPLTVPGLYALYSPATYVLLFLCLVAYAIHRENGLAYVVALPALMLLLTTLAGPLNGSLRYIMPLAAQLPLFAAVVRRR